VPTSQPTPALSAGGLIVYYSEGDGNAEIYTMKADGSDQQRLTDNQADDFSPAWSPDGSEIAFISTRNDPDPLQCFPECRHTLYLMDADGGNQRRLVETPHEQLHPAWSPDGAQLSFDCDSDGDGNGEIWIIHADGSNPQRLTNDEADERWADWSPDRGRLAFCSKRDGDYEIFVMDVDGSNQQRLTDNGFDDYFPGWSPDGRQIAYFTMGPGSRRQDIWVMDADGSNARQLTDTPARVDEDPAWSPDGAYLVFQSERHGDFEIYVMDQDGVNTWRLTNRPGGDFWPHWR
jgi:Tol biopolymer transport system component